MNARLNRGTEDRRLVLKGCPTLGGIGEGNMMICQSTVELHADNVVRGVATTRVWHKSKTMKFFYTLFNHRRIIRALEAELTKPLDMRIKSMKFEDSLEFTLESSIVPVLANHCACALDSVGADNYLEILFKHDETGQQYQLLIQKVDGITPGETIKMLKKKLQEARFNPFVTTRPRDGNTTRQVDAYIQRLFNGDVVEVSDHGGHRMDRINLIRKIKDRLLREHNVEIIYFDDYKIGLKNHEEFNQSDPLYQ